jgi:hypothetical protein
MRAHGFMGMRIGAGLLSVLAPLLIVTGSAAAAQGEPTAGRFIVVTGDVRILGRDGAARPAQRNGEFHAGESIVTGPTGLAQLRMTDGGAVSVRADSQFKLDVYSYAGSDDRNGSFLVSILKGGFRTITGLIARNNRNNYRISTASATIGVRGTHFEVVHLPQPLGDTAAGTYNRVYDGITTFQNRAGAFLLVSREQTAFVPLPSNLPPVLVAPPAGIFGKPTPVPVLGPQSRREGNAPAEGGKPAARGIKDAPAALETAPAQSIAPSRALSAPLLNPIDSPRVMELSPALQTVPGTTLTTPIDTTRALTAPTTTLQVAPALTPIDTAPATSTISPMLTAPATSTISPMLTAPATSTISPVLTAPATTTISPILTAPVTTTISPVLTAPVTTTISPILTAPTTTIQTAPTTSTIIRR